MEQQTISPELIPTRFPHLKMLSLGQNGFLFDKQGLSIRNKILYENYFKRAEFKNGIAVHLDFNQSFKLHEKLLTVSAKHHLSYGPLGDRINIEASYDGKSIGKYSALRSYMGGGSNGDWPRLIKDEWQVILLFELHQNTKNNLNHFSVNYFESLIPFLKSFEDTTGKTNIIREEDINLTELEERFSPDEILSFKKISWEHQIKDNNGNVLGKISCYRFPGFQRYRFNRYGKILDLKEHFKNAEPFISRETKNSDSLYVLEYSTKNNTEFFYPWESVEITGTYN